MDTTQSVVVYFRMTGDDLEPLHAIGRLLAAAIVQSQVGAYDGHETALLDGDDAYLFMVGPDADRLFEVARPILEASLLTRGAQATLRYGPPENDDVPEKVMTIGE